MMRPDKEPRGGDASGGWAARALVPLRALIDGLASRDDSEHEQAAIRLVLGALACIYLLNLDLPAARPLLWMVAAFLAGSLLLLIAVLWRPAPSHSRRYLGMCLDLSAVSAAMGAVGEAGAPLLAIYLWVIVGNGFRYGRRYLWISTGLAILGFSGVYFFSEFWGRHPIFSVSFLIILLLIPAYVAALLGKLNQAVARANEASQAKSRFLAKMSHELRTPLNGVIGMADLLMDSHLLPRQEGFARTIQTSARTLLGIIENILDFSKIEAGRIAIENMDLDLHRLAADILQMFQPQAQRKRLQLLQQMDPSVPFRLRGDPLHVRQVLMNLIGNAVKFTDQGSVKLRVSVARAEVADGRVLIRFEVEDTGIGIPQEEQRHIFEDFRQARGPGGRRDGGTGLGTAIARELAHLMGGQIGLESEPGKGTLFWVELPFQPQEGTSAESERELGARVLVLGEGKQAESLGGTLRDWGIEHGHAKTSAAALRDLRAAVVVGRPYGVLLAVAPELDQDPRQLAAAVLGESALTGLGLILVGASRTLGSEASLLGAGYAGVLGEPHDKTLLFNAMHIARSAQEMPDNVVSLAERYARLSSRPTRGLRILVAEDNETNRKVLQGILEQVGHHPVLAGDGEVALDLLGQDGESFDLMILDKNMPGRSGLEVFKAHRFMTRTPIPAILLTADATSDALAECTEAGVDAYLTKPVDTVRLLETIARLADQAPPSATSEAAADRVLTQPSRDGALVDEDKLRSLLALGGGSGFFDDLVQSFLRDGERAIRSIAEAVAERNYPALRAAIHALRGSASELGAARTVALCVELRSLKPFELGSDRAGRLVAELRCTHQATAEALGAYPRVVAPSGTGAVVDGPWARPGSDR